MIGLRLIFAALTCGAAALAAGTALAQSDTPIRVGQVVQGELKAGDRIEADGTLYDTYVFEGRAGQKVAIDLTSKSFDTYLALQIEGASVARSDGARRRREGSRIVATLPRDGRYLIAANAMAAGGGGAYTLSLNEEVKRPTAKPRAIAVGHTVEGRFDERTARAPDDSPYDVYRFRGRAGERLALNMSSSDFDAYLSVHKAGQLADLAFDDNSGAGSDAALSLTLPANGDYEIWANAAEAGETGAYRLSLLREEAASVGPRPIGYGDQLRGALGRGDQRAPDGSYYDVYRFRAERGDEVMITMRSSTIDSYLSLRLPGEARELVSANDDGLGNMDAELAFVAPASGEYEIWANALRAGEVGNYIVSVERIGRTPGVVAENEARKAPARGL